jgi:hypothetical protein
MAQATNTSDTYDVGSSGGNREDLGDVIWDLFPADTYALSTFPHESASATLHEWLGDELAAAGSNAQIEGDVTDATAISPPARYGNYQQIFKKVFNISATQEVVTKAGRSSEVARESMKQMREIKRDMEYAFTRNQIGTAGGAGTARTTAGMEAWIGGTASSTVATHVILSTTTASATTVAVTSGVPGPAIVDGTNTAAFTSADLDLALEGAWTEGGSTSVILVSPRQKKALDAFTSVATRFVDVGKSDQASIVGAADLYVSDFGRHQVIMHRYMRTSVALCIDPDMWAISFLRKPFSERLAKTGDSIPFHIVAEGGLVSRNWRANSKVVALA